MVRHILSAGARVYPCIHMCVITNVIMAYKQILQFNWLFASYSTLHCLYTVGKLCYLCCLFTDCIFTDCIFHYHDDVWRRTADLQYIRCKSSTVLFLQIKEQTGIYCEFTCSIFSLFIVIMRNTTHKSIVNCTGTMGVDIIFNNVGIS